MNTPKTYYYNNDSNKIESKEISIKRPITDFKKSFCTKCLKETNWQLNSDKHSYTAEFECQECHQKKDLLI